MGRERNEEAFNIGKKVFSESDLEFVVDVDGEQFTLKHPAPWQKAGIETEIARRLGGFSRDSFSPEHVGIIEATTYVDALVVRDKSPNWRKGAWSCYDEKLIVKLFDGYYRFRGEFQERIRGDGSQGNNP